MPHLPAEPPAFFHRGPSPLARLAFFGLLSIGLLVADARFGYLEGIRTAAAVVLAPLQRAAHVPGEALSAVGTFFASQRTLAAENDELRRGKDAAVLAITSFAKGLAIETRGEKLAQKIAEYAV
mgnify:CR=1 FL=1